MLRFAAAALAMLLLLSPLAAETSPKLTFLTQDQMQSEASQIGVPVEDGDFLVLPQFDLNAFFIGGRDCSVIFGMVFCDRAGFTVAFAGDWSGTSYEQRLFVLYHELGHYQQWKANRPYDEWDADVYAANKLCERGMDGSGLVYQIMNFLRVRGDRSWSAGHGDVHGSYHERVENVRANAKSCHRAPEAA